MIVITPDFLKTELQKADMYEKYLNLLPTLKDSLRKFRQNPHCSICLGEVINVLRRNQNSAKWVLARMYNDNSIVFELGEPTKKIIWQQGAEVHRIPLEDYERWVKRLYEPKEGAKPQVKSFDTFYEPDEKVVVVTVLMLRPVEVKEEE